MRSRARVLVSATIFFLAWLPSSPSSQAGAASLTYPTPNAFFPKCTAADQEFCIELMEFTPTNGTKRTVTDPTHDNPFSGTDPSVQAFISGSYAGPSSLSSTGYPPSISINYYDPVGSMEPAPPLKTAVGLADGLYRVVLRTGDFDPTYLMLTGTNDSYSVTKGADGYWTVDLSARPMKTARVVAMNGDQTMMNTCQASNWLGACEANFAYQGYILASFAMLADAAQRESGRGMWISSNASMVGMGNLDFLKGETQVNVKGPHYVPTDFPTTGLTAEGGRHLNPAYYEMFMPFTMITKMLSQMSGKEVTVDQVKTFLSSPKDVMEGTVKEAASATASAVEKTQSLTTTVGDTGVRVNFNLTHYSAPDPTLKLKVPSALSSTTAPTTSGGATTSTTTRTVKALKNGASVSLATAAAKGKTLTGKSLVSPSTGARVSAIVSKSKSVCTVKGTSVKMLKAGTCRLSATVKVKNKSSSVTFSVAVS